MPRPMVAPAPDTVRRAARRAQYHAFYAHQAEEFRPIVEAARADERSLSWVARRMGVASEMVSAEYVPGWSRPPRERVVAACEALGIDVPACYDQPPRPMPPRSPRRGFQKKGADPHGRRHRGR